MGKKKRNNREKAANRPRKPRYTLEANLFYRDMIAPLQRKYHTAMRMKNYEEAGRLFKEIAQGKEQHRLLLHRKEKVRIK